MPNNLFAPRYDEYDAQIAFGNLYQGPPRPRSQVAVPISPPPRYPHSREDTIELKRSEYEALMKLAFTDFPVVLERLNAVDLQLSQIAFNTNPGNGRAVVPALCIPSSQPSNTQNKPAMINRKRVNVSILRIKIKGYH